MPVFSEKIYLVCEMELVMDSWGNLRVEDSMGNRQIMNIYGRKRPSNKTKWEIILDTEKMNLFLVDSFSDCNISSNQDWYVCSKTSNSTGKNITFTHYINRKNLEYKYQVDGDHWYKDDGHCKVQESVNYKF